MKLEKRKKKWAVKYETVIVFVSPRIDAERTDVDLSRNNKRNVLQCSGHVIFITVFMDRLDRLCGQVVRVPAEMNCVSCEVRTEFIYVM
jgi:hypothetical protein